MFAVSFLSGRDDCVAAIEDLAGRTVAAFMSANHIEPELAAEMFVLKHRDS